MRCLTVCAWMRTELTIWAALRSRPICRFRKTRSIRSSAKGGFDGFIALINPSAPPLNSLLYSSYVTGPGSQIVYGVDFDASGTIYSTGFATGNIFPAGYQTYTAPPGIAEVFIYGFKP